MPLIYLVLAVAATALSTVALIPALIVAGVALVLATRYELLWLGGKVASIRAPTFRPEAAKKAAPAETVKIRA